MGVPDAGFGRAQLRVLVEQTRLPVAACDAAGRLTLLSPPLEELFGQPYEPIPAAEYPSRFRLFAHDGVTPLRAEDVPLTRAMDGEVVRDAVVCTRSADGRRHFLRCNAAPLQEPDGTVVGALVLVQDVTADKAAESEQAELRSLLDAVTQLIDLDAHTRLSKRYGDLAEVIRDIATDVTSTFGSSAHVRIEGPPRLAATIDPLETRRAIWELLKNAATYGPAGAVIVLQARGDEESVRVSVIDRGSGIPPRERDRVVHAFERGSHAQQPVNAKGLGLAIARTVATAHGGRLELGENAPHGLRATLVLPRFDGSRIVG